ncbi:CorA family divalent cation transporter [Acidithiobacillus ferriphilus]|uniref:CorA family divalent cation transporter n=1 Tax=Acidithiobacillus ferriphilus TaxID=1689834 RepID=UPI001C07B761|nr:CorA family divalent cation transporter [Acidithiobacillus ferriphilus]MBU2854874.1 hypothetical protein [Acidithiobacillus ferriphilus]
MNSAVQTLLEQPTTPLRQTAPGWLWLHQPDTETIRRTAAEYAVDEDFFHDVLDPDEHPRLMREDGKLFIILQVPWKQPSVAGKPHWDLRPMGIIFQAHGLLTIGSVQWPFLQALFDAYRTKPSEDLTRDLLVKMIRGVTDVYEQALHDLSERKLRLPGVSFPSFMPFSGFYDGYPLKLWMIFNVFRRLTGNLHHEKSH